MWLTGRRGGCGKSPGQVVLGLHALAHDGTTTVLHAPHISCIFVVGRPPSHCIRIFLLGCPGDSADSRPAVTAVAATSGSHLPTPFARKSTVQLLGWKDVFCCYRDNRGTLHSYAQHSSLTLNIFYAYVYVTKCIVKQAYSFFLQEAETLRLWAGTPTSIFRTENTRFSTKLKVTHCPVGVINKPTTVELWISPVYRRLAVAKFSQSTM